MTNREAGIRSFRKRLTLAIRDYLLAVLNDPKKEANIRGIPVAELGSIADLTDEQRTSIKGVIVRIIDTGIQNFLYGLDNDDNGFEVRFNNERLNADGSSDLSDSSVPISEESEFDKDGNPKGG